MVGLGRFELPTSPLSGVRSNQLSYRPIATLAQWATRADEPAQAALRRRQFPDALKRFRMKGHEDGGNVLWNGGRPREQSIRRNP
jgi:hypothetical protein